MAVFVVQALNQDTGKRHRAVVEEPLSDDEQRAMLEEIMGRAVMVRFDEMLNEWLIVS